MGHMFHLYSASIFWKAFSPCIIQLYAGQHGDQHGEALTSSLIHRFVGNGNYKLSSTHKVYGCRDLPEMASVLTTCAFFPLVINLQGIHVMLPVRSSEESSMQMNYAINLSYLSFAPLLFQDALAIFLYIISEERRNITVAQPDSVPLELWRCYVGKAAFLVGLCIGALELLAGLAGVVDSGTGIMHAVTVLYSCLEETSYGGRPAGAFGF